MKKSATTAESPASPTTLEIPEEINLAAELDKQYDRLAAEGTATEELAEEAKKALAGELLTANLRDQKTIERLTLLRAQADLAPRKSKALEEEIERVRKELQTANKQAFHLVGALLLEASRGNVELAAIDAEDAFPTRHDARKAMRNCKQCQSWNEKARLCTGGAYAGEKLREIAHAAIAEIARVRALLPDGNSIPSAREFWTP